MQVERTRGQSGRTPRVAIVFAAALLAIACVGGILDTDDPDVTTPDELKGPSGVPIRSAGIINDFREAYDGQILYTGLFTDEFVLAGTFLTRRQVDERDVLESNATLTAELYQPIHTSRFSADDALDVFTAARNDPEFETQVDLLNGGLAVASFYAGYSRILLAEAWCQSILGGPEGEPAPLGSDARMQEALTSLRDAERHALDAGRPDLETAARVGQARGLLWLRQYEQAATLASTVPSDFLLRVEYSGNSEPEENQVFAVTWGEAGRRLRWTVGNGAPLQPHGERYAYYDEWVHQGLIIPPDQHELVAFGNTGVPVSLQTLYSMESFGRGVGADAVLASGWEARMIEAEAAVRAGDPARAAAIVDPLLADPSASPLQALNPTIPIGSFAASAFTGDLQNDLREIARARQAGLWLTGERMATARRFLDDGVDLFPPGTEGSQIAMPVVEQELNNNPNVSTPCPEGFPGVNP